MATGSELDAAIDPALFRETLGQYPTGVAVITGLGADGAPLGMVVGTFAAVSFDPPLVSFMPMKSSSTFGRLRDAGTFCVNVLASDQEAICRTLSSRDPDKFAGIPWHPSPHGAPILDGVVAWVECEYEQILEAGDHYIVLGRVIGLASGRPALPLLFFQSGYGQFSLSSLVAAASQDFVEAVRMAESIREDVERCAEEYGADCAVLTRVSGPSGRGSIVTVSFSQAGPRPGTTRVGTRLPHLAPIGAVYLDDASETEIEAWLAQVRRLGDGAVADALKKLSRVRERGFSFSLDSERSEERHSVQEDYNSSSEVLPKQDRRIREWIAQSLPLYEPDLVPGRSYDVYALSVPLMVPGVPPLSLRLSNLPQGVASDQIEDWAASLRFTAEEAAARLIGYGTA